MGHVGMTNSAAPQWVVLENGLDDVQFAEREIQGQMGQRTIIQHIVTLHCGAKAPQPLLLALADKAASFVGRSCFGTLTAAIPMALCKAYVFYTADKMPTEVAMQEMALASAASGVFAALVTDSVADAGSRGFQFGAVTTATAALLAEEGALLAKATKAYEGTKGWGEAQYAEGVKIAGETYKSWVLDPYCKLADNGPAAFSCKPAASVPGECPTGLNFKELPDGGYSCVSVISSVEDAVI